MRKRKWWRSADRKKKIGYISRRIYNMLDVAEKVAIKLVQINQIIKQEKRRKNIIFYSDDKYVELPPLKKYKKCQKCKPLKRYDLVQAERKSK